MVSMNKRVAPIHTVTHSSAVSPSSSTANIDYEYRLKHYETLVAPSEQFSCLYDQYLKDTGRNDNFKKHDDTPSRCSASKTSRITIENLLRKCNLVDDPLQHWLDYIDFIKREYDGYQRRNQHQHQGPSKNIKNKSKKNNGSGGANHSLFLVRKRCTFALFHHPQYKNDPRYIRVIVLYADQLDDSNETEKMFWYYYKQRIGIQTAIFWISFAFIMEKNFDYKEANRIYITAMNVNAQPMDIILKRYRDFQQRVRYYGIDLGGNIDLEAPKESSLESENYDIDKASHNSMCGRGKNERCSASKKIDVHVAQEQHGQQYRSMTTQKFRDDKYDLKDFTKQQRFQDLQSSTIISRSKSCPSTTNFTVYQDMQDEIKPLNHEGIAPTSKHCIALVRSLSYYLSL